MGTDGRSCAHANARRQRRLASAYLSRHGALYRLLPLRPDLRRAPGPVRVARAQPRRRHAHPARWADAARQLVRGVRRMRGHMSDGRTRGPIRVGACPSVRMDPDHVPVLRRRLRVERGHSPRAHRLDQAGARRTGQQGTSLREGPLRVRLRLGGRSRHAADDSRRDASGGGSPGTRRARSSPIGSAS